jgi:putative MATE family efflux protein
MQNAKKALLVEGPIGKTLVKLTIPMIFGILGMVAFNLVDTFFIGQLGTNELAAISFTFPIVFVIGSLAMGLGVGAAAVISRAIGEGNPYKVQRLTTDGLILAVSVVVIFVLVGLLTIEPLFRLLGATPEVMPFIKQYMLIWYPGMVFVVVPMVGNNAIRATGDTKTPSAIMLVAVVTNIVLDPLFIFGWGPVPRLELAGAAIATVIARAVTLFVSLWVLYRREKMITFELPAFKTVLDSWKRILYIGLPAAGTNMIMPVGMGVITRLIAIYGPEAVAAFGVASRLDMFAMTVIMALSSVLGPFVGQNWGAGQQERVNLGVKYSHRFAMGWGAMMLLLLATAAEPIASLFNDNPVVISTIVTYLWLVPLGYGLLGMLMLSNVTLNVLNKPLHASALMVTQMFVLYIPLAYTGSYLFGVPGIFGAAATANVTAGLIAYLWLRKVLAGGAGLAVSEAKSVPVAKPLGLDG